MQRADKALFAQVLFRKAADIEKRGNPDAVPKHVVDLYDEATEINRNFASLTRLDLPHNWIVLKLAEIVERLDRLEAALNSPVDREGASEKGRSPKGRRAELAGVGDNG